MGVLEGVDRDVAAIIAAERQRQREDLELIASENYASMAVMEAAGSVLTNKYAEGLPGKRYYGGCEEVDRVEELARERAIRLFSRMWPVPSSAAPSSAAPSSAAPSSAALLSGHDPGRAPRGQSPSQQQADIEEPVGGGASGSAPDRLLDIGANVQPHSGAQANAAVYLATLKPGDTLLGLDLSNGGHLTHGSQANSSGKIYRAVHYKVNTQGIIDLDHVRDVALRERPKVIVTGASAYPRTWDFAGFRQIADEVGAVLLADVAHVAGLVVAGLHPSPFPHCDIVSTTTHKTLRGPRGGLLLAKMDRMKALNSAVFPGTQGGPLMHIIAAKAVAFGEALRPEFRVYAQQVIDNAQAMAGVLLSRGVPLVSGGTDNHLMLLDLSEWTCSGKDAEEALGRAGITVNKNTVPGERRSPFVTSGIRIGTPAMTTRGMGEAEARQVAGWIADVLQNWQDGDRLAQIRAQVHEVTAAFAVPGL